MLMTIYIYPLQEKILLSKTLNAYLDNPRTPEDIRTVQEYIELAYSKDSAFRFPPHSDDNIITLEGSLQTFYQNFSQIDDYISEFYKSYDRENIYDFMARMWVVARYDDLGEIENLRQEAVEMRASGTSGFFLLEDDHPIMANSKQLVEYSYLLSLLFHTEGQTYHGRSFVLDDATHQFEEDTESNRHVPLHFLTFAIIGSSLTTRDKDLEFQWKFLPHIRVDIQRLVGVLDNAFMQGHAETLFYIASVMKNVGHDTEDNKIKLLTLIGIVELLVTHNPDFNRFNVEDSISKQFSLKASLLVYLHDKGQDINAIKNNLKTIYNLRSNIAHGNFSKIDKYVKEMRKKGEENSLESLVSDLYLYIRIILLEYLKNPILVEFLKNN